ncbi:MAG: hypothetical protein QG641_1151, partial [Candidatus Poribacteria bacterium]|nr:hypothetical protein [Candidatus Poribacteria bacterium]
MLTIISKRFLLHRSLMFIAFFILYFPAYIWAQSDNINLNMPFAALIAPPSPGFILLGIEPAAVERPGTVTDLKVSILQQTENLTTFPEDYAIEFAPYWLCAGEKITYEKYASNGVSSNILHTASISMATISNSGNSSESPTTSSAFGIRFSILQGDIDENNYYTENLGILDSKLSELNIEFSNKVNNLVMKDEKIICLQNLHSDDPKIQAVTDAQIEQRMYEVKRLVESEFRLKNKEELDKIKETISGLNIRRTGWKLDFAGGSSFDFPQREFKNGILNRWGAWLTGGYEWDKWSALNVIRYLGNHKNSEDSSIDFGLRLILNNIKKASFSAEAIYRRFPNRNTYNNQKRFAFILDYAVAKNKV